MKTTDLCETALLESAIAQLYARASQKGKLTLTDCCGLAAALLSHSLSEAEKDLINRLMYAIRRGWLEVVSD
jgi:hypothetical protein